MATVGKYDVILIETHSKKDYYGYFQIKKIGAAYGTANIMIIRYPTGNCQLSSVAYMNTLLSITENNKDDVWGILRACYNLLDHVPKLAVMDVRETYAKAMDDCFSKAIIHKHPYINTNGSHMILYMVSF